MMVKMMYVDSSMFTELGYDQENLVLCVRFTNGSYYQYHEVPEYVWDDMQAADSMGKYFAKNIRDSYRYSRVDV